METEIKLDHLDDEQLRCLRAYHVTRRTQSSLTIQAVDEELMRRYGEQIDAIFAAAGKDCGTVTLSTMSGKKVRGVISKQVIWDQDKLSDLAAQLPTQFVNLLDITFSVPERAYKTLPPEIKAQVDEARTVKYGSLKIAFQDNQDHAA